MPRRRAHKLTPVELMILFAMLGILTSIVLPALHRAPRQARAARGGLAAPSSQSRSTEGQFNTIEPPATETRTSRDPVPARRPRVGSVAWLVVALVIFRIVNLLRRRGVAPLLRKPRHKHPPDAEE